MKDYQQRVVTEKRELDERREKLDVFIRTELFQTLPVAEQHLMIRQLSIMCQYSKVLGDRIALFDTPTPQQ